MMMLVIIFAFILILESIKYFFISFAILLIILLATAYYMLNTVSGMRKTISLVNEYTDYSVSVETIKGGLLGKTEFENFRIAGEGINVASKHLLLDWQFFNLFKKELIVESIVVDDTTVVLPTSQEKPDTNATGAIVLDDIELPINFHLKDVQVNNPVIKAIRVIMISLSKKYSSLHIMKAKVILCILCLLIALILI